MSNREPSPPIVTGLSVPEEIRSELTSIEVDYVAFSGSLEKGTLIVHKDLAKELSEIFYILCEQKFPIDKIAPLESYGWNDEKSMQDNNTSAFNYREIIGTNTISNHSSGRAIDINPLLNPYYARDGKVHPEGATYDPPVPGTLTKDLFVVELFKRYGWTWLGERAEYPDYQHFEKPTV